MAIKIRLPLWDHKNIHLLSLNILIIVFVICLIPVCYAIINFFLLLALMISVIDVLRLNLEYCYGFITASLSNFGIYN